MKNTVLRCYSSKNRNLEKKCDWSKKEELGLQIWKDEVFNDKYKHCKAEMLKLYFLAISFITF